MCPDCGQAWFKRVTEGKAIVKLPFDQCTICGWIGNMLELGRKIPTQDMWSSLAEEKAKKEAGKLFFVRVYFNKEPGDKTFDVMEAIDSHGASNSNSAKKQAIILRVEKRPTDEQLANVKKISGVVAVEVW